MSLLSHASIPHISQKESKNLTLSLEREREQMKFFLPERFQMYPSRLDPNWFWGNDPSLVSQDTQNSSYTNTEYGKSDWENMYYRITFYLTSAIVHGQILVSKK